MRLTLVPLAVFASLLLVNACSHGDREKLHDKASNLAHEAKQQAHQVASDIKTNDSAQAEEKLHRGEQDLKKAGAEASVKLAHAALEAKVKARLANDLGASSLTNISVAAADGEVTLTGHVASTDQKTAAGNAAAAVPGVAKVRNDLTIAP